MKLILITLGVVSGIIWLIPGVFVTTSGCAFMPIDLVIGGEKGTCVLGSFILSAGATTVATIIAVIIAGVGLLIKYFVFGPKDDHPVDTAE